MFDCCELCEDGDDCIYCCLAGLVKLDGKWADVTVLLDPCVETPIADARS